jgi:hypothetical protein
MVADAIVEHIKLCNWKVERGAPWEGLLISHKRLSPSERRSDCFAYRQLEAQFQFFELVTIVTGVCTELSRVCVPKIRFGIDGGERRDMLAT